VATEKDKGLVGGAADIVGGAADTVRETTSAGLGGGGPWHSANSEVYHDNPSFQIGNSTAPENVQRGTGGKPLCKECERLDSAGGPVGNLTGL